MGVTLSSEQLRLLAPKLVPKDGDLCICCAFMLALPSMGSDIFLFALLSCSFRPPAPVPTEEENDERWEVEGACATFPLMAAFSTPASVFLVVPPVEPDCLETVLALRWVVSLSNVLLRRLSNSSSTFCRSSSPRISSVMDVMLFRRTVFGLDALALL